MIGSQDHSRDVPKQTPAVCCGCTCCCDDVHVAVKNGQPVFSENVCGLGRRWFADRRVESVPCRVGGKEATIERAIETAVEMLKTARRPLICGLQHLSTSAQQAAVNLAQTCRATVDTSWSNRGREHMFAFQQAGRVTASLGQISQQCDTLVFWNVDPASTHPRLMERYCQSARQIWFVGSNQPGVANGNSGADQLQENAGADFLNLANTTAAQSTALWTIRAILDDLEIDAGRVKELTGVPLDYWRVFVGSLKDSSGVAWFVGGSTEHEIAEAEANSLAAHQLIRRLNDFTKGYLLPLRTDFNGQSAENVLSWSFGFPFAVNLNNGQPRWNKLEFTASNLLAEQQTDCVLTVLGDANDLASDQIAALRQIPTICLHSIDHPMIANSMVSIPIAQLGWDDTGELSRLDDMTLVASAIVNSGRSRAVDLLNKFTKQFLLARPAGSTTR